MSSSGSSLFGVFVISTTDLVRGTTPSKSKKQKMKNKKRKKGKLLMQKENDLRQKLFISHIHGISRHINTGQHYTSHCHFDKLSMPS